MKRPTLLPRPTASGDATTAPTTATVPAQALSASSPTMTARGFVEAIRRGTGSLVTAQPTLAPAPRNTWRMHEAHNWPSATPPVQVMQTDRFDPFAIQRALASDGEEILAAVCGLPPDALERDASRLSPTQLDDAYNALCDALQCCGRTSRAVPALGALLLANDTAYSPTRHWHSCASLVSMVPLTQPVMLLSANPSGFVSSYLSSLWQHDVSVAVSLSTTAFWPASGLEASFGAMTVHTDGLHIIDVLGLDKPIVLRSCRLSLAGVSRALTVVHVPWPDFAALPGATLLHVVDHVEAVRQRRAMAIHCGAGLGRSGTFALAHAMLADKKPRSTNELLTGFLRLRLQRRDTIETSAQFASIVNALGARQP